MRRLGAAAAIAQGLGLLGLTFFFAVLFPRAGMSSPADLGDPARYLPAMAAHPSWFYLTEWGFGLLPDTLFVTTLIALHRRFRGDWIDAAVAFGAVGLILYLFAHLVSITWAPELIAEYARAAAPATAAQYVVLARIYNAALVGGSLFTGIALALLGALIWQTRTWSRALGALAIAAGILDAAMVAVQIAPALPLTGVVVLWLGLVMWRDDYA